MTNVLATTTNCNVMWELWYRKKKLKLLSLVNLFFLCSQMTFIFNFCIYQVSVLIFWRRLVLILCEFLLPWFWMTILIEWMGNEMWLLELRLWILWFDWCGFSCNGYGKLIFSLLVKISLSIYLRADSKPCLYRA